MNELRQNGTRYRVMAIEGYTAEARRGGNVLPGVAASVLDSACAWREVARFTSEDNIGKPGGGSLTTAAKRVLVKALAHREARRLNAADA